jgi:hypothetical protein
MVMCHPDDASTESWTGEAIADKMRSDYAEWEPRSVGFLNLSLSVHPNSLKGTP